MPTSSWRLAPTIITLRDELNREWPLRDKTSDGTLGNASHAASRSDHNPDSRRVVCAMDIDEDLSGSKSKTYPRFNPGQPAKAALVDRLLSLAKAGKLPQLAYVIYERRIYSRTYGWVAKAYNGANAHEHHVHISVRHEAQYADSTKTWNLRRVVSAPSRLFVGLKLPLFKGAVKVIGYNRSFPTHVSVVQIALRAVGLNPGPVDGLKGQRTVDAMNAFLAKWGWPEATGKTVTFRQLDRLIWEAEKKAAGTQYPPRTER